MDFGQLLLDRGLISPQELEAALAEQRRYLLEGREPVPRLGEILVSRGCLSEQQVAQALASQQKEILYCRKCKIQVNVDLRSDAAGYRCGTCGGDLEKPSEVRNVKVVDTSVILVTREPLPEEVQHATRDPARKFGKYVLLEEIGRGGAAIVHRAWDTYLNQFVALKFVKPTGGDVHSARHEARILDLLKEARSTIRLRHPNIVTIYDVGRLDKQFYIAMECLEGHSLAALVRIARDQGKISPLYDEPRRFVAILRDVARAVHHAHTRQSPVIHCDVKPSNVFIDNAWRPHVLDFGLARHLSDHEAQEAGPFGMVRGTPAYMAPEQAAGKTEDIDARTDVYGIGSTLYELLTGRPPFSGELLPELLRRVINEPPIRPSELPRLSPPEGVKGADAALWPTLERICLKALEKDKSNRYQTAREIAEELDRLLKGESTHARAAVRTPSPAGAAAPPLTSSALVRGAVVMEGWLGAAQRHWRGIVGCTMGGVGLLVIIILMQRPLPPAATPDERIRAQLEELRRRVDVQIGAFQLDQAKRAYAQAASYLAPEGRAWLEDAQEDLEWLIFMRNHLIAIVNKPTRYSPATFRLRDRELRDVVVLHATSEKLVLFHDNHAAEVPWSALEPETVTRMVTALLVGVGSANPADRLGLGIYCVKSGFPEQARAQFEALRGSDLEVIARRYLSRLDQTKHRENKQR